MGRNTGWLVANRPTMVKVLTEIQRNFSYAVNEEADHDSKQFFAWVAEVTATKNKQPRSVKAMRRSWLRWTTEESGVSTPPVLELALIVRYAKNRGWLAQLKHPDCVSLIGRLINALVEDQASTKESSEIYWRAEVHKAFPQFDRFLEKKVTAPRGNARERNFFPTALVVQSEVGLMLAALVERAVRNLEKPREVFEDPQVSDAFLKPFEGWPDAFRGYASEISRFLNNEADYYEDTERALVPLQSGSGIHIRRKHLLPIQPEDAEDQ